MPPTSIDKHDRARFGLTMISNLVLGQRGPGLEGRLHGGILRWLSDPYGIEVVRGDWEVVWGPAVKVFDTDDFAINAMYVVRKKSPLPADHPAHDPDDVDEPAAPGKPPHYVIAIAGTNPTSTFNWIVEDFQVSRQVVWKPDADEDAKISFGTSIGFDILLNLEPGPGRPGTGRTLVEFLWEDATALGSREIDLWVCGHSLGGALAPTLALWLTEDAGVRELWDPYRRASVSTMPMAGASPGNADFSARLEAAFPGDRTRRYVNTLDVVPHAWEPAHLREIPTLYKDWVPAVPLTRLLAWWAGWRSAEGNYTDVKSPLADFVGVFERCRYDKHGIHLINFANQMVFQHIHAYFRYFDVDGGEMLAQIPPLPATPWSIFVALLREMGIVGDWAPVDSPAPLAPAPSFRALRTATDNLSRTMLQQLPRVPGLPRTGPLAPRSFPDPGDGHPLRIRRPNGRRARKVQRQLEQRQLQSLQRSRDIIKKR